MTESARKRKSKWDIKGETHHSSIDIRHDNVWFGKAGVSIHGEESQSELDSSKSAGNHGPKWSDMEATITVQSMGNSGWSCAEPSPGNEVEHKDENINRDCDEISKTTITWGGNQSYSTSMSPGLDGWREQNHRHSPNSSWSRSCRSRSRSPPHGFRHRSEGWNDRTGSGSGVSSTTCRDFAAGRCRRGVQCRFFHADTEVQRDYSRDRMSHGYGNHHDEIQKHDSQRNNRPANKCFDFLKGKCHRGSSCKYAHHSTLADDNVTGESVYNRRDMNASHGRDHRREPRRIKDVLCKYFTLGNCHHGEYCTFSHESVSHGSLEERSRDDKWGHDLDEELKPHEGSKWSKKAPDSSHEGLEGMSQDDRLHFNLDNENRSWGGSKWNDKAADHASTQWLSENNGASMTAPKSLGHEKSLDATNRPSVGTGGEPYAHFTDKKVVLHDHQNSKAWTPNEITSTICEQNISVEVSGWQQQHPNTVIVQPTASENANIHQHPNFRGVAATALPYGYGNAVTNSAKPQNEINFSGNILQTMVSGTGESFNQNGQSIAPQNFAMNEQSGQSSNPSGQLHEKVFRPSSNPHHQTLFHLEEPIKKPDTADTKMSQMISGTPMTQNIVISEQASQIANLSASLAQIFGSCQQLPQLYAVLNQPPNATEMVPSLPNSAGIAAPVTAPFIPPSQATWSQKQHDLNSNNIELSKCDIIIHSSGTLGNPIEQSITASEESGAPSKSLAPPPATCELHRDEPSKIVGLVEKFHYESHEFKQVEPVVVSEAEDISGRAANQINEWQETGHTKDMDLDGQIDEEGKRSKDGKGMRMFKFTLVEFVKEILKPTWKEGQMSKESHKTIVKKVVDKVTGTIQGAQIPQTQEKIDHYLSNCKPKLTKLVQAYVEKYLKN